MAENTQYIPSMFGEPYAYVEIANRDQYVWSNVKEYDVVMYASHSNMSYHLGASPDATSRLSMTPTECMFYNDFFVTNQMVMRGIQLQESPVGDNTPYQVTQQVSDIKGFDPWGTYIKVTLSNGQSGLQVLNSSKVPQITLSTTTGRIHANSNDTAVDPSYSWSNNSNLGIYHYDNDVIGFACVGLESAKLEKWGRFSLSNQTIFEPQSNMLRLIPTGVNCNVEFQFASCNNLTGVGMTMFDTNRNKCIMGKTTSNMYLVADNSNLAAGQNWKTGMMITPAGVVHVHAMNRDIGQTGLGLESWRLEPWGRMVLSNQSVVESRCNMLRMIPTGAQCNVRFEMSNLSNNIMMPELSVYDCNNNLFRMGKNSTDAYLVVDHFNGMGVGSNCRASMTVDCAGIVRFKNQNRDVGNVDLESLRVEPWGRMVLSNQSVVEVSDRILRIRPTGAQCNVEFEFMTTAALSQPKLTLYDVNRDMLAIGKSTSNAFIYTCNNNLDIGTNSTSCLFIDPIGQVGLQTIYPTAHFVVNNGGLPLSNTDLQVQTTANALNNAMFAAVKSDSTGVSGSWLGYGFMSNVPTIALNNATDPLRVMISGSEKMRWDKSSGWLGVFTQTPKYEVDLVGNMRVSSNLFLSPTTTGVLAIGTETPTTSHIHVEVTPTRGYSSPSNNAGLFVNNTGAATSNHAMVCLQANKGQPFISFNTTDSTSLGWSFGISNATSAVNRKLMLGQSWSNPSSNLAMMFDKNGTMFIGSSNYGITSGGKLVVSSGGLAPPNLNGALVVQLLTNISGNGYYATVNQKTGASPTWFGSGFNNNLPCIQSSGNEPITFLFNGLETARMTSNSWLGMGMSNPTRRLHMLGGANAGDSIVTLASSNANPASMEFLINAPTGLASDGAYITLKTNEFNINSAHASRSMTFYTANSEKARILPNGYLGVGTTPATILHVKDTSAAGAEARLESYGVSASNTLRFTNSKGDVTFSCDASNVKIWDMSSERGFMVGTNNVSRITMDNYGNVALADGKATACNDYRLYVQGKVHATLDVTTASDARLKEDLVQIQNATEKVSALTGYTYVSKNDASGRRYAGVIAQDVEKVLPEAVTTESGSSMKSVSYGNMVALLVEAIKDLTTRVASLEKLNNIVT